MSLATNTAFSDVYGGGSGSGGKLRHRNATNPRRAAHIRILVLGPPLGFPRCFDDYYHYNIEAMISGPEVAMALFEWVSNTDERKRLQVERAANELKQKILMDETNSLSHQKAAAALKPSPPPAATMTNQNNNNVAMNGGGCNNTAVAATRTKVGAEVVLATSTSTTTASAAACSGDNHSRASSSGRSSTKSAGSLAPPIQQQIPSATLTNVTGSDLAKEVREILKNQKLAAETQKQQQQEHQQQQQLQLQQQKQLHHRQNQNRKNMNMNMNMNGHGGQQTPASGNSTNASSVVTPVSSIQDLTASTAASTLLSAFSVGAPGPHDNQTRSGGVVNNTSSSSSGGQNNNNNSTTFAGLEEIARHSRIRQKVIASGVFHDHGDDEDEDDNSCTGVVDSNMSGDDNRTKISQQRQNHDRNTPKDGGDSVPVSSPNNNKQPAASSNRSRRIPTNTNRQALPMTIPTKKRLRWHALVDSGMGRLGFKADPVSKDDQGKRRDTVEILKELVDCEVALDCPIEFYGMCTHMADASNSTSTFTDSQMNKFKSLLKRMRNAEISVPTISTDNSAALLTTNLTHFTTNAKELLAQTDADSRGFVRTGGAIYGQRPSFSQLQAVSTLMASVRHVATLKEGESVGYDRAYVAPMNVRIATLTIGFADGYPRELGNGVGRVSIRGHLFPVAGNVCMDMLMVELGPAGDKHGIGAQVVVGDTAVLWGPDDGEEGEGHVRLQDVAATLKTTQSALTCGLNKERVLRQYA